MIAARGGRTSARRSFVVVVVSVVVAAAATAASAAALTACSHAKEEAQSLSSAIDRWHAASDADKPAAAAAISAVACTDEEVCETKRACLAVASPTVMSLALRAEVERKLGDVKAGRLSKDSPEAQALPEKLDQASSLLSMAASAVEQCDTRAQTLKRKYGS